MGRARAQWSLSHAVGGVAVTNSHPSGMRGVDLEPRHATPRAEAKDIVAVLRPRIERELCEVGGALRRKVEAEYQSEIVEKCVSPGTLGWFPRSFVRASGGSASHTG